MTTDTSPDRREQPAGLRRLATPRLWLVVFVLSWLVLVIVQISMGMGGDPGSGGAP
jgi:hypothetical protein